MPEVKNYLKLPSLSPLPERHFWVVNEDWDFYGHTVPRGFVTDLDSTPHIPGLFAIVKGRARWSALGHDFLYSSTNVTRYEADRLFLRGMLEEGVPPWIANPMYLAVRSLGWRRYNKKRRIPKNERLEQHLADYTGDAPIFHTANPPSHPNA